jgi:hypothetical protein
MGPGGPSWYAHVTVPRRTLAAARDLLVQPRGRCCALDPSEA